MLKTALQFGLILVYVSAAAVLGVSAYIWLNASYLMAICLGFTFALTCGLLHSQFTPRTATLSKTEKKKIENEFNSMRDKQEKLRIDFENLKGVTIEKSKIREEKITHELKNLASVLSRYMQMQQAQAKPTETSHDEIVLEQSMKIEPKTQNEYQRPNQAANQAPAPVTSIVKEAVDNNRIELHVQPIVSLPQRHIAFYECFMRLRDNGGEIIMPSEFMKAAESNGMDAEIDNLLLLKCIHLVRRMVKRDRRIGVFFNLAPARLADETFFAQFIDYLRQNRDLVGSIIFELPFDAFENLSMTVERNMGRLYDLGFRFSLDRCPAVDLDLRRLEKMGIRYVKIAGATLIRQIVQEGLRPFTGLNREFNAEDVASLYARFGVELVADRIEDERTIVELLDLDLGFAQGNLFGAPRAISDFDNEELPDRYTMLRRVS